MTTQHTTDLDNLKKLMAPTTDLAPRKDSKRPLARPIFTGQAVSIVGIKTVTSRFLPVSHEGHGIETYVDKVDLLGKRRAEFIARKLKGIERRAHMRLFRELVEHEAENIPWQRYFEDRFSKACSIPDNLCIACWNCSLFGAFEPGKQGTFSRIRYFDTYSVQDANDCIACEGSEEGMGIGNQLYEDLMKDRSAATYHLYEYVKAGTVFPFITIIEQPTLLDVAGYLATLRRADGHGYGRYSANHGKFSTKVLVVAAGFPRFSTLDLLQWAEEETLETRFQHTTESLSDVQRKQLVRFDSPLGEATYFGDEIESIEATFPSEFQTYVSALQTIPKK